MTRRLLWWCVLLGAAALAVALAPPAGDGASDAGVVPAVASRAARTPAGAAPGATTLHTDTPWPLRSIVPRVPEDEEPDGRLWGSPAAAPVAVAPPPAVVQAPAAPPPPMAPVVPFRVLGRYADGGRQGVVLLGPDGAVLLAHAGEKLGDDYQVESVAGNFMVLRYLPFGQQQTLDIGITQ